MIAVTVTCDGSWDGGRMPCRASLPCRTTSVDDAVDLALVGGWSTRLVDDTDGGEHESHLCPACSRFAVSS